MRFWRRSDHDGPQPQVSSGGKVVAATMTQKGPGSQSELGWWTASDHLWASRLLDSW